MDDPRDFDNLQPRLSGFDLDDPGPEEQVSVDDELVHSSQEPRLEVLESQQFDTKQLDLLSDPFVGRWQRLVSSANWEKGLIILAWREALIAEGAPVGEYSDETWARRVSTVTGQHTGRLRRVAQRFGSVQASFNGLSWSHFQVSIDWEDAEMWLQGAVQSSWSVSQMRQQRWETLGGHPNDRPREEDVIMAELDEDHDVAGSDLLDSVDPATGTLSPVYDQALAGPLHEGPDFGEQDDSGSSQGPVIAVAHELENPAPGDPVTLVSPFRDVENLPADLAEALEAFKLAILRHKSEGWQETSCESVLANLEALKQLALAAR